MENREAIERALELLPQMRDSEWITAVGQVTAIYTDEAKEVFNTAISALEKQKRDGWIPCSVRLPEEKTDVLCCFISHGKSRMRVSQRVDYNYWSEVGRTGDMVAWRPLPAPYQEDEA